MKSIKSLDTALFLALVALMFAVASSKVPHLPKPTPNCPECRDATAPLATVKE